MKDYQMKALTCFLTDAAKMMQCDIHIGGILGYLQSSIFTQHTIHSSSFCTYVKSSQVLWNNCIRNKQKILAKLQEIKKPFYGVCHCGVKEFIAPVFYDNDVVAYITAGGFRPDENTCKKRINATCKRYSFSKDELCEIYDKTVTSPCTSSIERIESTVITLSIVFSHVIKEIHEMNVESSKGFSQQSFILQQAVEFIHMQYTKNISLDDIASFCNCSRSHIQHLYKQYYHTSVTTYLEKLRMEQAKKLLKNSITPINQIAYLVGYNDVNYFSLVFKKKFDYSPSEYRIQSIKYNRHLGQ